MFFHRSQMADEMEEELRSHVQHRADDLERSGVDRAEAERRARIEFGGREKYKEECHEALGGNFIEGLLQDLRYALRVLRKSPGFTIAAVLTLALAIGANAVVFACIERAHLAPAECASGKSLYAIERGPLIHRWQSYPDYLDLRDRNRSFDGLAALYHRCRLALDTGKDPSQRWVYETTGTTSTYWASAVSWPFFSMPPTSTAPTAPPISCSAMRIGTAIFRMIRAWWAAWFS